MIESVNVIGARGRVGSAVSARLAERGVELRGERELVLLCVPDRAIAEVAAEIEPGPWVAHVSGGTPLGALDPHATGSRCTPCRRSRSTGARSSSTVRGERSRARRTMPSRRRPRSPRPSACGPSSSPTRVVRSTTPARRSPPTTSSRSAVRRASCSPRARPRGARSSHATRDRERVPADRPDRARRLGDGRAAPLGHRRRCAGFAGRLRRARDPHRPGRDRAGDRA